MARSLKKVVRLALFVGIAFFFAVPAYGKTDRAKTGVSKGTSSKRAAKKNVPVKPAAPASVEAVPSSPAAVQKEMQKLRPSVMGDPEIVKKIFSLLFSPDFQDLVHDPEVMRAVRSLNIKALMENPKFVQAVNHPTVREISQKIEQGT